MSVLKQPETVSVYLIPICGRRRPDSFAWSTSQQTLLISFFSSLIERLLDLVDFVLRLSSVLVKVATKVSD
jgi:hypothetical protein